MLIRTVRMTFKEDKVDDFLEIFDKSKNKIRQFDGCTHLELLKDYHETNIYSTYSIWEDDRALNNYRHSGLFKEVWAATKVLFKEKPVAFSSSKYIEV